MHPSLQYKYLTEHELTSRFTIVNTASGKPVVFCTPELFLGCRLLPEPVVLGASSCREAAPDQPSSSRYERSE